MAEYARFERMDHVCVEEIEETRETWETTQGLPAAGHEL